MCIEVPALEFIEAVNHYTGPSEAVAQQLRQRAVALLIGPAAVGKSYVRATACRQEPNFHQTTGFTTRPPQKRDAPNAYRFLSHTTSTFQKLQTEMDTGQLVNIACHPTTGHIYGSSLEDYPAPYNLIDMLSSNASRFRSLPFKRCVAIAIATESASWHEWFLTERVQISNSADALKRLVEGQASLRWSLSQGENIRWLYNVPGDPETSVQSLIAIIREDAPSDPHARELGHAMLASIPDLQTKLENIG